MPSVAAASSLSRIAVSWRPNQLRRTTPTSDGEERRTPPRTRRRRRRRSSSRCRAPRAARRVSPPRPNTRRSPSTASRPMRAMPKVLSARCRPRRRTAGRATRAPRHGGERGRRASMPTMLSPPATLPVTKAPTPTNRYCVSDTWPDSPVTATSERAMVATTRARTTWPCWSAGSTCTSTATVATRAAPATERPPQRREPRARRGRRPARPTGGTTGRGGWRRRGTARGWPAASWVNVSLVGPQPRDVRELLAHAEQQRADERHRQAREPADHRRAVGVEHEQRQDDGVQVLAAGEQDPAEGGQPEADHPAEPGDDAGADAVQAGQLAVVDDGPHAGPERRAEEQEPQARRRRRPPRRPGRSGRR